MKSSNINFLSSQPVISAFQLTLPFLYAADSTSPHLSFGFPTLFDYDFLSELEAKCFFEDGKGDMQPESDSKPDSKFDGKSDSKADSKAEKCSRPDIYAFRDYRDYIRAVIEARKTRIRNYRRIDFARAIGFASDSGLNMVLTGQRELRPPYLDKCIRNLKLDTRERLYFEALVRASGLSPGGRRSFLREVEMLTGVWEPPVHADGIRLIDYFIVQQILGLRHTYVSVAEIREMFRYPISEDEVQAILEWMHDHGYADLQNHRFKLMKAVMAGKDEIPDANLRRVHTDAFRLAEQSLSTDPLEAREFQTYFFTVDSQRLGEMKQRIKKLVLDVISEFETELDADSAVQMHFNLFEVIKRDTVQRDILVTRLEKEKGNE